MATLDTEESRPEMAAHSTPGPGAELGASKHGAQQRQGLTSVVYGAGVGITAFFPERLSRNAKRTSSGSDRTTYARSIFHQVA